MNHTMERIKGKHHTMEIVESDEGFEGLVFVEGSTSDYMDTPEWCSGRSTDKLAVIRDTVEALMNYESWFEQGEALAVESNLTKLFGG